MIFFLTSSKANMINIITTLSLVADDYYSSTNNVKTLYSFPRHNMPPYNTYPSWLLNILYIADTEYIARSGQLPPYSWTDFANAIQNHISSASSLPQSCPSDRSAFYSSGNTPNPECILSIVQSMDYTFTTHPNLGKYKLRSFPKFNTHVTQSRIEGLNTVGSLSLYSESESDDVSSIHKNDAIYATMTSNAYINSPDAQVAGSEWTFRPRDLVCYQPLYSAHCALKTDSSQCLTISTRSEATYNSETCNSTYYENEFSRDQCQLQKSCPITNACLEYLRNPVGNTAALTRCQTSLDNHENAFSSSDLCFEPTTIKVYDTTCSGLLTNHGQNMLKPVAIVAGSFNSPFIMNPELDATVSYTVNEQDRDILQFKLNLQQITFGGDFTHDDADRVHQHTPHSGDVIDVLHLYDNAYWAVFNFDNAPDKPTTTPPDESAAFNKKMTIIISCVSVGLVLIIAGIVAFIIYRRKHRTTDTNETDTAKV